VEVTFNMQLTGLSRLLLLPVRVAGYTEYVCVVIAPLACALAWCFWRWLSAVLPDADGDAGENILSTLRCAAAGSLVLVILLALDGDPLVRFAVQAYLGTATVYLVRRVVLDRSLRRQTRTWGLFLPLIMHYKALHMWVQYAKVAKEQEKRAYSKLHAKYAPLVYQLMVDLGGLYVKAGQLLSMIPAGVLPPAYTREFKKMQNGCPSRPSEEVQRQIAEALRKPIADIFSSFEDKPLGTASISQVHRARLAKDGRDVVIKVQYPEVAQSVDADFSSMALIVRLLDSTKLEEVREARRHFDNELDFETEAETLERVHANMKKPFPNVLIPEPVRELCTPMVLVMTYIPGSSFLDGIMRMAEALCNVAGTSVDDVMSGVAKQAIAIGNTEPKALEEAPAAAEPEVAQAAADSEQAKWAAKIGTVAVQKVNPVKLLQTCMSTSRAALNMGVAVYNFSVGRLGATPLEYRQSLPTFDPVKLSRTIWRVHGHQLILNGLFNSDPHPGNILIDDTAKKIGLIDFGMMCELGLETRVRFARLLVAIGNNDDREIAKRHVQFGMRTRRNSTELLALSARLKFGAISDEFMKGLGKIKELEKADPILRHRYDEKFAMAERLLTILRGTSFICGVGKAHCATGLWLDMANSLLEEHGGEYAVEDATTDHIELDMEPAPDDGTGTTAAATDPAPDAAAAWKFDLVPLEAAACEDEFFEIEDEEEA